MSEDNIVRLDVGGVIYKTSRMTLLSAGDTFFGALVSGQLPSTKTPEGAYFIDRDGEYFRPILEYLRTQELFVPSGLDLNKLLTEARFYCVMGLVEILEHKLAPPREVEAVTIAPKLRFDGYYGNDEDTVTYYFKEAENKMVKTIDPDCKEASTHALVLAKTRGFPTLWRDGIIGTTPAESAFGEYILRTASRGRYWLESPYLKMMVAMGKHEIAVVEKDAILVFGALSHSGNPTFNKFLFRPWPELEYQFPDELEGIE